MKIELDADDLFLVQSTGRSGQIMEAITIASRRAESYGWTAIRLNNFRVRPQVSADVTFYVMRDEPGLPNRSIYVTIDDAEIKVPHLGANWA